MILDPLEQLAASRNQPVNPSSPTSPTNPTILTHRMRGRPPGSQEVRGDYCRLEVYATVSWLLF
jgi:hypothetical protein